MRRTVANVSGHVHQATVAAIQPLADAVHAYTFTLTLSDGGITWQPGQFISLCCGNTAEGDPLLRSYSLASSPSDGALVLVIKSIPGGAASSWLEKLRVGDEVRFTGPMGFFVLDPRHPGDVVLAATGTGIAPVMPMVRALLERQEEGRIFLYWGLRSEQDLFWQEELAACAHPRLDVRVHLSQPTPTWTGARGRITGALLERLATMVRPTFYLVGNGAMIRELKQELVKRGVERKKQIRTEAFFEG